MIKKLDPFLIDGEIKGKEEEDRTRLEEANVVVGYHQGEEALIMCPMMTKRLNLNKRMNQIHINRNNRAQISILNKLNQFQFYLT
jgi:hypothetical protein